MESKIIDLGIFTKSLAEIFIELDMQSNFRIESFAGTGRLFEFCNDNLPKKKRFKFKKGCFQIIGVYPYFNESSDYLTLEIENIRMVLLALTITQVYLFLNNMKLKVIV
tara:strand:- start:527 stop:853 length:327 start_codon:yes stop_codon:yes gene_type:complete